MRGLAGTAEQSRAATARSLVAERRRWPIHRPRLASHLDAAAPSSPLRTSHAVIATWEFFFFDRILVARLTDENNQPITWEKNCTRFRYVENYKLVEWV